MAGKETYPGSIQMFATYIDSRNKKSHRCQLMSLMQGNAEIKRGQMTAARVVGYCVAKKLVHAKQFYSLKLGERRNRKPHTSPEPREMRNRLMAVSLVERVLMRNGHVASHALCSKDHRAFSQYLDQLAYVAYEETC